MSGPRCGIWFSVRPSASAVPAGFVQCRESVRSLPRYGKPSDSTNEKHEVAEPWNDFHSLRPFRTVTRFSAAALSTESSIPRSFSWTWKLGCNSTGSCGVPFEQPSGTYSIGIPKNPANPNVSIDSFTASRFRRMTSDRTSIQKTICRLFRVAVCGEAGHAPS